jgi:hypothetical protein
MKMVMVTLGPRLPHISGVLTQGESCLLKLESREQNAVLASIHRPDMPGWQRVALLQQNDLWPTICHGRLVLTFCWPNILGIHEPQSSACNQEGTGISWTNSALPINETLICLMCHGVLGPVFESGCRKTLERWRSDLDSSGDRTDDLM